MRCWHLRPGCAFGRTFAHHFSAVFDLHFGPHFEVLWRRDLPVYGCFLDLECWSGPVFGPLLDRTLDRVSGTWKSNYAPCRIKIPWTCVCPSAKGSVSREVNKPRKAGIQSPAIPFSRRVLPSFWPAFGQPSPVPLMIQPATHPTSPRSHPTHSQTPLLSHQHQPQPNDRPNPPYLGILYTGPA
jgi:hypothetical protein